MSTEAEHRTMHRAPLFGKEPEAARGDVASKLSEFRQRTADRSAPSTADLLAETRCDRVEQLAGKDA